MLKTRAEKKREEVYRGGGSTEGGGRRGEETWQGRVSLQLLLGQTMTHPRVEELGLDVEGFRNLHMKHKHPSQSTDTCLSIHVNMRMYLYSHSI